MTGKLLAIALVMFLVPFGVSCFGSVLLIDKPADQIRAERTENRSPFIAIPTDTTTSRVDKERQASKIRAFLELSRFWPWKVKSGSALPTQTVSPKNSMSTHSVIHMARFRPVPVLFSMDRYYENEDKFPAPLSVAADLDVLRKAAFESVLRRLLKPRVGKRADKLESVHLN